jgi:predicted MFS family arabinose efflux permease
VALAILFSGPSLAIVGGVPLATFIGQRFGWHAAFGAVAATATVVLGILAIALHDETTARAQPGTARSLVRSGPFRSLLVTTVLVVLGQFVAYTYVVPYVERIGGFPADAAAPLLLLFGLAGALGNLTAGMIAQRRPAAASLVTTASIVVALLVLCVAGVNRAETIAALGLWGWGSGGLAVGLHALAPDAPDLASALFSGSFNIGIGGGALLGGVIYAGFGLARIAGAGAALAICALLVQCVSIASERNRARSACAG